MYRTILVPVDGSEASRVALRHAVAIANGVGSTVHVLTVVEPSGSPLAFGVDEIEAIDEAVADLVDAIVASDGSAGATIRSDVRRGRPAYELILEYADEIDADLIVLGRRGTSTLPKSVFGTTADRVARLADVPVTLVAGTEER